MGFNAAHLAALEAAYAAGTTSVKHGDKQHNYASMDALWAAIQRLRRAQRPARRRHRAGVVGYTKM